MNDNKNSIWFPFEKFGSWARLEDGTMIVAPMLTDGSRETFDGAIGPVEWEAMGQFERIHFQELGKALLDTLGVNPEGEAGDFLEETCSKCHVKLGDDCQCE